MKNLFLSGLSAAINAYLALDPESAERLKKLQGKVVTLELRPFSFIFQQRLTAKGIELSLGETFPADTHITGTPLQLLGMMITKENRQHFFADDLTIKGDAEVGQQIIALFDELEIEWEEYFSQLVGDVPAHHLGTFSRRVSRWLKKTESAFTSDVEEYLHEEAEWFPTREALEDFFNQIDTLRMDTDRITEKIKHFQRGSNS